jgi:hypothetical protein
MIYKYIYLQLGWHPMAVVQYIFTHKQHPGYIERQYKQNEQYNIQNKNSNKN